MLSAEQPGPQRNHPEGHILLYDGVCGLCNSAVQFILKRDHHDRFCFAALQGSWARERLGKWGISAEELQTMYLIVNPDTATERVLSRGRAVLFILDRLGGIRKLAGILRLLPARFVDWGYDEIARRRYRFFGRHESCLLPRPEFRKKFLDPA